MSRCIIFSFDDGRKDQYDVAYKILSKYDFPATINVVSEFINNEKQFFLGENAFMNYSKENSEFVNEIFSKIKLSNKKRLLVCLKVFNNIYSNSFNLSTAGAINDVSMSSTFPVSTKYA